MGTTSFVNLMSGTTTGAVTFLDTITTEPAQDINVPTGETFAVAVGGTDELLLSATNLTPGANDGNALGSATVSWADLFLASGGVINWNNGDVTLTHSANALDLAGGTIYTIDAPWRWGTGVAVTAAQYEVGRDADATNQLHFNVPTGATFEWSINDSAVLGLSSAAGVTTLNLGAAAGFGHRILWGNGNVINDSGLTFTSGGHLMTGSIYREVSTGGIIFENTSGTDWWTFASTNGNVTFTPVAVAAGSPTHFTLTGAAHTSLTASTEATDVNLNLARTVQFATGALTTQRAARIQAPTYSFVGASTLTDAIGFDIDAAPSAGTNATFTNTYATQIGGNATIGATSAGMTYGILDVPAHTVTVTGTTQVTSSPGFAGIRLGQITVSDASAVTVDTAASLYIANAPVGGGAGPVTITTPLALWIDAGGSRFDGITTANAAINITIANTGNDVPLEVTQNDTTNNPRAQTITNTGTGNGLFIDQDGNGNALNIDGEQTTADAVIFTFDTLTTGRGIQLSSASTSTGERELLNIANDNAAATATRCISVDQNANSIAIRIDSEATSADVIEFLAPTTTTGNVINIAAAGGLTSGRVINIVSDSADATARRLLSVVNDNTAATGATNIHLQQDAANEALFIDQNGTTAPAIEIDQDSNSAARVYAVTIVSDNAGAGGPGGIDMSSFSAAEPLLSVPAAAITTAGTVSHQVPVNVAGTIFYIVLYTAGS